jgi:hypothetical protein
MLPLPMERLEASRYRYYGEVGDITLPLPMERLEASARLCWLSVCCMKVSSLPGVSVTPLTQRHCIDYILWIPDSEHSWTGRIPNRVRPLHIFKSLSSSRYFYFKSDQTLVDYKPTEHTFLGRFLANIFSSYSYQA